MLQLQILSGKTAGVLWDARRFPVKVGRSASSDLQLEEDGIWQEHFRVELKDEEGFYIAPQAGALVSVNQAPTETVRLRNGDVITVGSVRLAFRLSETKQRGLKHREALVWALLVGITASQLALICWLWG